MDTGKIEQLLERIASRLDNIHDELKWYNQDTFGECLINSIQNIENRLSDLETGIADLGDDLSNIRTAIESGGSNT
jgi:hypothetical protein